MCFDDDSHPPVPLSDGSTARGSDLALQASDGATVMAYTASPGDAPAGQVIVLPDVRGLHDFYRELALRFADVGIQALVIDYFARTATDGKRDDTFEYMPHVERMAPETFVRDLAAGIAHLRSQGGASVPLVSVGFCMGGSLSFYAGTLNLGLDAVVGFYAGLTRTRGAVTPAVDFAQRIHVPVLGLFGGADSSIPQVDIDRFEQALRRTGTKHEIVVYSNAPHGFFDRKAVEFADASADAWIRIQGFIADLGAVTV